MILSFFDQFMNPTHLRIPLIALEVLIPTPTRDIIREGTFQGHHTPPVQKGFCYGIEHHFGFEAAT
ncbi:COX3 oxidase, partial [Polyodon spathula]|nr:COX3 oxidase [Polyodon spathula]